MVFPEMKKPSKKKFSVDRFVLRQNTVLKNGTITTRNGIKPIDEVLFETEIDTNHDFVLTEAVLFKNNRYNRLCVNCIALGSFRYRYEFSLVSVMGVITRVGSIQIAGEGSDVRKPASIMCFSAAATKGCGIYAYMNIETSNNGYIYEIYELSVDLAEWILLTESDMYIPQYLKNGRGIDYLLSAEKLPEPEHPEPLNVLGGVCRCSFTTDSVSRSFYLPVASAIDSEEHIKVTLKTNKNATLNFKFGKGVHVSDEVEYDGYKISLLYEGGYLFFNSTPYGFVPERISGVTDNLEVFIKHETPEDYDKKAFMTHCSVMSLAGEGEQVVFTGNKKYPSLVSVSKPNNPLYFPENLRFNVGADEDAVIGMAEIKNKLALFKSGSVYIAEVKDNKYSLKIISRNHGCRAPKSIRSVGNAAVFVDNDSKICAVMPDGTIKEISTGIANYLDDFKFVAKTCSAVSSSRYILFADTRAYCLDLKRSDDKLDKPEWDIWTLPYTMDLYGVFEHADKPIFIGRTCDDFYIRYYLYDMNGEREDIFYEMYNYYMQPISERIVTTVKTGLINPDNSFSHKMLERALFYVNNNANIKTEFLDDKGDIIKRSNINISYEKRGKKPVRLYPLIPVVQFELMLETEAPLELQGIDFQYYNLD